MIEWGGGVGTNTLCNFTVNIKGNGFCEGITFTDISGFISNIWHEPVVSKWEKNVLILPLSLAMEVKFIFNIQQCFRTLSGLQLKENQLGNIFFLVCFKYTEMVFVKLLLNILETKIKTSLMFTFCVKMRNTDTYGLK